ncbi:hypothetical protein OKHIL_14570 [Mycolicibacterium mageritense]|nr:hypothetical protein MTY414_65460 [Mycolicibacterium mageritense]
MGRAPAPAAAANLARPVPAPVPGRGRGPRGHRMALPADTAEVAPPLRPQTRPWPLRTATVLSEPHRWRLDVSSLTRFNFLS